MTQNTSDGAGRHRYLQALDQVSDALYIVTDGAIDAVNGELTTLTGYDRSELVGESPTVLFHDDNLDERTHRLQLLRGDSETDSVTWTTRFVTKHGTELPVELECTLLQTEDGTDSDFVVRARDTREQNQQEQKLDILNRALRHNIRNQMNVIIGNAAVLQDQDDPSHRTAAETIEAVGEDVINLSEKARKAQEYLDMPPDEECNVDLSSTAKLAVQKFDIKFPNATVTVDIPESAMALAPPSYEIALLELMENATVHHPSGSGPVAVSVERTDETVTLRVRDECAPIADAVIETVQRGEEDPLEHNEGLGLWIVKWMTDTVEGELTFQRRDDGVGNEVTVVFKSLHESVEDA
jgi:PAS domain S-box-containing protein